MAIIGSVGVRVAPNFTGLGSAVSSAFATAGRDAGRAISRPVQTSLRDAVRSSITSASTSALTQVESATAGVTRAEQGLQKAKLDSEKASASAQVAEERLASLRDSGRASAGELNAAEASLNDAKAKAETASQNLSTAEDRVATAKQQASTASAEYEAALARESSALYKVEQALPAIGGQLQTVGTHVSNFGRGVSDIGGSLTRNITMPAGIAAGAVAGLVGTLGFQRLVSMDSAQAQLRGLGYEAEDVDRITGNLVDSIEGGMMTMGEATSTAAGALAAGVEEGEELERYIKLVDAAAVGMGRSVDETAMIFGRVQGSGKLMTQELNMIEQSMPGFAAAMADSLGVTQEEFREMVTAGEVGSEEFMNTMETFAGGMAEEYAQSWEGMVQNTKAYIGILGENILSGVFPQLKESLGEFIEFLSSDEVAEWAKGVGESLGNAFATAIEWVQSAINWWMNLDGSTQKLILTIAGIAVVLGPILLIVGKLITFIGSIITAFGTILSVVGPVIGAIGKLGAVFGLLLNPITWVVAGIAALVAGLTWFFTQTEIGQQIVSTAWAWIQIAIAAVVDWMVGVAWPLIQTVWDGIVAGAQWLWETITVVWGWIQDAISTVVDWLVNVAWPLIQSVWDGIATGLEWVWGVIEPIIIMIAAIFLWLGEMIWDVYTTHIETMFNAFTSIITWLWENVAQPVFGFIGAAFSALGSAFVFIWESVLKPVFDFFISAINWLWENVAQPVFGFIGAAFSALGSAFMFIWTSVLKPVFDFFISIITWLWENVARPYFALVSEAFSTMGDWLSRVWANIVKPMISAFGDFIVRLYNNYVKPALGWIMDAWDDLSDTLSSVWRNYIKPVFEAVGNFVKEELVSRIEDGVDRIKSVWDTVAGFFRTPINWVINTVWNSGLREAYNTVASLINADELDPISEIGRVPAFAKGGYHRGGWAVVGEQGPELVNFSDPGRVYTAAQTRSMLKTDSPEGTTPEEQAVASGAVPRSQAPIGGLGDTLRRGARWIGDATGISDLVDLARGALADGFRKLMEPITNLASDFTSDWGGVGQLSSSFLDWGVEKIADLIDTKDQEQMSGGEWGGEFTANPGGFNRPAGGPITSWAGPRNFALGYSNFHWGVDLGAPAGSPVRAAWAGAVKRTGWGPGNLGNIVVLNHGGYDTAYAHLSSSSVSPGQQVSGGQRIGSVGSSGGPFAPHLHFEKHTPGFYNPDANVNALFRDKGGLVYPGLNLVRNETGSPEYTFNRGQFDNLNAMAQRLADAEGAGGTFHNHQYVDSWREADRNAQAGRYVQKRHERKVRSTRGVSA